MDTVKHFLRGGWIEGEGEPVLVRDPVSDEPIASLRDEGLDLGAALAWGREVGGPTLRAMSFAERGAVLGAWGRAIHAHRDELLELARRDSGNTRGDAKFDVDGAAGTLAYYAALGRELGEGRVLADGEAEPLLRSKRFVGRHWFVPRRGVAVHLNAFNFPAWGLCEKAACAILAGVPVFAKPAPEAPLVAARIVAIWHEEGLIPEGALQLLAGRPGDLLDHLEAQDVVAFTGSRETGRIVRAHPRVLALGVPVNVEADSLNAAVVGPDVEPDSDTFQMFAADVARDLSQKAGQKCTALRRILVPVALVDAAVEAIGERVANEALGDPSGKDARIGPLATSAQRDAVRAGIAALGATARLAWEHPGPAPADGAYVAPALFRDDRGAEAPFVHEHEIFGPVATILPYEGDPAQAARIVARGGGGLVCAVYSDDAAWAGALIGEIAPWHGRIVWGSAKVHDQGAGPGTVLPNLVHGGPGAAGGGEELGGLRGLQRYWQRVAIQGDRALLERLFG